MLSLATLLSSHTYSWRSWILSTLNTYYQEQVPTPIDLQACYKTPRYLVLYQAKCILEIQ